jgi:hypothetical protein
MGNTDADDERRPGAGGQSGETQLRGDALTGPEQKRAVDHATSKEGRNPDTELHVDNEEDTLYNDGVELEDDTPPMGTAGRRDDNAR